MLIQGVCLVWNLKYKRETPEYVFTSESPLVTARYQAGYIELHPIDQMMLGSPCSTPT